MRFHALVRKLSLSLVLFVSFTANAAIAHADEDLDRPPIEYSKALADNPISRLQTAIDAGEVKLDFHKEWGYLPALLAELKVPVESQMLVYSKTSLLRHRITPETPRALYFNDEVYIGNCQKGEMIEIAAADPRLGAVFYALDQKDVSKKKPSPDEPAAGPAKPQLVRQDDNCMICHRSSRTDNVPGFFVRSLYVDPDGQPILSAGSRDIDHTTPLADRWGGWYVTGTHGKQTHLGNLVINSKRVREPVDNAKGQNVAKLDGRVAVEKYLTPHSDLVALMVFEHQALVHNRLTKASYVARQTAYYEDEWNRNLGQPAGTPLESTARRIRSAGDDLIEALLFSGEAKLTEPVAGSSDFAKKFAEAGPRDAQGRSLRELDLTRRMFKYPCSFLIYSPSFDALPAPMLDYVYKRMWEILTAETPPKEFAHLSAEDRRAILEILKGTKKNLPKEWQGA